MKLTKIKNQEVELMNELLEFETVILELYHKMSENRRYYLMDQLTTAVLKRSLSLIDAFVILTNENNYYSALHLIRLHLDSLLRYSAVWLVNDPNEFISEMFKGNHIRELVDDKGNKLTDTYLVKILSKKYKWVKKVYGETSGFIHLSSKHAFATVRKVKDMTITNILSRKDHENYAPDKSEGIEGMIEITKCLLEYANGWVFTKNLSIDQLNKYKK